MAQRNGGYERLPMDLYQTPDWVTEALVPHIPKRVKDVWEPAAGNNDVVKTLRHHGYNVRASDIKSGKDFLKAIVMQGQAIITNPPYGWKGKEAEQFTERALMLTKKSRGFVAMLLRIEFDSAETRPRLFGDHPAFAKKIVLRGRVRWIKGSTGSPSDNHGWFVWDWKHQGPPTIAYEDRPEDEP